MFSKPCYPQTISHQSSVIAEEEVPDTEELVLPEEMDVIGVDDSIHPKSLQSAIDEVSRILRP